MQTYQTPVKPLRAWDENAKPAVGAAQAQKKKPRGSSLCQTPPTTIRGYSGQLYRRGTCLGQGGFARCFQVTDGGQLYAAKTIAKVTMIKERERTKLLTEIRIHRSLKHCNIVNYIECFEDELNIYILLEMCGNESLYEMSRRRKVLTEPESRYFMIQILGAVNYMHSRMVIHRDLKLGNIFLDKNMNVKIGDFGLAALLSNSHERRKSICGTPNYLSPEVLNRPHEHSFPTDMWALGIILYAFLFGKPPFQEKDVQVIYRRIKEHELVFPTEANVSEAAISLVNSLLHPDPFKRITVEQAVKHRWFQQDFPATVPASATRRCPTFNITPEESKKNFQEAKAAAGLLFSATSQPQPADRVTADDVVMKSESKLLPDTLSPPDAKNKYKMVLIPDENADVEPASYDSPIVDRQQRPRGALPTKSTVEPLALSSSSVGLSGASKGAIPVMAAPNAAMPLRATRTSTTLAPAGSGQDRELNQQPIAAPIQPPVSMSHGRGRSNEELLQGIGLGVQQSLTSTRNVIWQAIEDYNAQVLEASSAAPKEVPIYVSRWADFNDRYGVGWGLSDGSVGMRFIDGPSMRMDPRTGAIVRFDMSPLDNQGQNGDVLARRIQAPSGLPDDDQRRVQVLRHAAQYMLDKIGRQSIESHVTDLAMGAFLANFVRTEKYVMFVLSSGAVQFNFTDHNKVIFLDGGKEVFIIAEDRTTYHLPLANAILRAEELEHLGIKPKLEAIVLALMN